MANNARGTVLTIDVHQLSPYVRFVHELEISRNHIMERRVIYDYEIVFITRGSCIFTIKDKSYTLRAGDIQFIQPLVLHSLEVLGVETCHHYAVHFDPVFMGKSFDFPIDIYLHETDDTQQRRLSARPMIELQGIQIPPVLHTRVMNEWIRCFRELLGHYHSNASKPIKLLQMKAVMLQLISLLLRQLDSDINGASSHPQSKNVSNTIEYLHAHYDEPLHTTELAENCSLSPKYFRSIFKRLTGRPISDYLTSIRMDHAKRLLQAHEYTVQEVASKVGFEDFYYFSKLFKKAEGLSPKKYADSLRRK